MSTHKITLTTPQLRAVVRMLNEKLCGACDSFSQREITAVNRVLDKLIAIESDVEHHRASGGADVLRK